MRTSWPAAWKASPDYAVAAQINQTNTDACDAPKYVHEAIDVGGDQQQSPAECSRSPDCMCPLCKGSAEAMLKMLPSARLPSKPVAAHKWSSSKD